MATEPVKIVLFYEISKRIFPEDSLFIGVTFSVGIPWLIFMIPYYKRTKLTCPKCHSFLYGKKITQIFKLNAKCPGCGL